MANKERITITIDPTVLARIDQICEMKDESRSAFIERALRNEIELQGKFLEEMDSQGMQALYLAISHPAVLNVITRMAGERMSSEEIQRISSGVRKQAERAKDRKSKVKGKVAHG